MKNLQEKFKMKNRKNILSQQAIQRKIDLARKTTLILILNFEIAILI